MKVPNVDVHRSLIQASFLILLGAILGAVLMLVYFSKELDRVYSSVIVLQNDNQNLINKIEQTEKELKSWNARSKVNDILIYLKGAPNDIIESILHRQVQDDIRFLIGKEIRTIENSYESIFEIFSPKTYSIEGKEYRIELINMVIGTKLRLHMTVKASH